MRVLPPSRDTDLAFPTSRRNRRTAPCGGPATGRLQRRWLAHRNAEGRVLRHNRWPGAPRTVSTRASPSGPRRSRHR